MQGYVVQYNQFEAQRGIINSNVEGTVNSTQNRIASDGNWIQIIDTDRIGARIKLPIVTKAKITVSRVAACEAKLNHRDSRLVFKAEQSNNQVVIICHPTINSRIIQPCSIHVNSAHYAS